MKPPSDKSIVLVLGTQKRSQAWTIGAAALEDSLLLGMEERYHFFERPAINTRMASAQRNQSQARRAKGKLHSSNDRP
jgi:hypothetical protein